MLSIIYERYSNIDILINNAAVAIDTLFEDKTKRENLLIIAEEKSPSPYEHGYLHATQY